MLTDPVDALVIHMMPVVGQLAPQVQAEHQAAREPERESRHVQERVELLARELSQRDLQVAFHDPDRCSPRDPAVEHPHRALGVRGVVGRVRDHHDARAFLVQPDQDLHDLGAVLGIEIAGRFVGEDQVRLMDDRARDRDALLLTARELPGQVIAAVADVHALEHGVDFRLALAAGVFAYTSGNSMFSRP